MNAVPASRNASGASFPWAGAPAQMPCCGALAPAAVLPVEGERPWHDVGAHAVAAVLAARAADIVAEAARALAGGLELASLAGHGVVSHLSAMTVAHGTRDGLYAEKRRKLGEDPLRDDADPERLWGKVAASKKSIGALVMDQSCSTRPGNIYRAEILFKAGVHPDRPGNSLSRDERDPASSDGTALARGARREERRPRRPRGTPTPSPEKNADPVALGRFDLIWHHTVELLKRGYATGSILTVDEEDERKYGQIRRYIDVGRLTKGR